MFCRIYIYLHCTSDCYVGMWINYLTIDLYQYIKFLPFYLCWYCLLLYRRVCEVFKLRYAIADVRAIISRDVHVFCSLGAIAEDSVNILYIYIIHIYFSVRVPTSSYSLILLYIRELYVPRVTVKHFNCQLYGVLRYTQNFSQRKLHT